VGRGHSALTSCARCGSVPPLSGAEVYLELIALALAVLPLGAIGMRLAERAIGRTLSLTIPERLILCFYAAGAAFFVLASLPLAIYGVVLVAVVLVGGVVGYGVLAVSERGLGLRAVLSFARSFPALVVGGLTLALLGVEVAGAAPLLVGNVFDGSVHSLFITLLLRNHTLPWTLSPYASVGVTYPQGAPVWMSLPVLLFDWPVVSAPVDLPPLFLALSAPAAYCLGFRLAQGTSPTSAAEIGMVFSAFFALVAAFPRLWIGGSFDVAFGFGLFLATVGWIVAAAREPNLPWRAVAILGVLVGIQFSLSLMLGIAELLLLAGYAIVYQRASIAGLARWAVRWLAVVAISAGFLVRSLLGVAVWFRDPGHVLTPVGQRPLAPSMLAPLLTSRNLDGELNPFVLFKPKLSPFPWMSLEIMVLVGAGLVLAGALVALPPVRRAIPVPSELATSVLIGTLIAFVSAGGLILAESVTGPAGVISVTNSDEASAVLFTFYEMLAVLPLIAVVGWWRDLRPQNPAKVPETESTGPSDTSRVGPCGRGRFRSGPAARVRPRGHRPGGAGLHHRPHRPVRERDPGGPRGTRVGRRSPSDVLPRPRRSRFGGPVPSRVRAGHARLPHVPHSHQPVVSPPRRGAHLGQLLRSGPGAAARVGDLGSAGHRHELRRVPAVPARAAHRFAGLPDPGSERHRCRSRIHPGSDRYRLLSLRDVEGPRRVS